jgi:hypothetical protein
VITCDGAHTTTKGGRPLPARPAHQVSRSNGYRPRTPPPCRSRYRPSARDHGQQRPVPDLHVPRALACWQASCDASMSNACAGNGREIGCDGTGRCGVSSAHQQPAVCTVPTTALLRPTPPSSLSSWRPWTYAGRPHGSGPTAFGARDPRPGSPRRSTQANRVVAQPPQAVSPSANDGRFDAVWSRPTFQRSVRWY